MLCQLFGRVGWGARLALVVPVAGMVGSDVTAVAAAIMADPGSRDTALAPLQAPVDRVASELGAARAERERAIQVAAAAPPVSPPPRAREYARVVAHFERVLGATPEAKAAVPSAERTTPQPEGDRSDAVKVLLLAAGPDATGAAAPVTVWPAAAPVEEATVAALQESLRAREAVIADLLRRVTQLERRVVLSDAQLDQAVGGAGPVSLLRNPIAEAQAPAVTGTRAATTTDPATPPATTTAPDGVQVVQAQAQGAEAGAEAASAAPTSAPGQFEIDEAQIDRALERTLVQEGALLLPAGQVEVEPSFQYTRRENKFPTVVNNVFLGQQEVRRNEFEVAATFRVGLPFDSQIEVGVPYNIVDESDNETISGSAQNSSSETGNGLGDVSVSLAKTLLQEGAGWWPDVIARVTYDSDSGDTRDNGVFLGGGFNAVSGSLSAVKRQDPLAFVGSVSYSKTFENDDVEPGDEVAFSIGTVLAASPETSLSFFFNQTFADDVKINGDKVGGSDQVIGTFSIGAATTLGSNVLLSVTGEIGLTDDAPDYAVGIALPIRFNLPTF